MADPPNTEPDAREKAQELTPVNEPLCYAQTPQSPQLSTPRTSYLSNTQRPSHLSNSRTRYPGPFRMLPTVATSIPFYTTCPYCGNYVLTTTSATPGLLNWLLCTTLFLLGCVLGCCLLPFCIEELMDVRHRCPVCRKQLYRFRRL